MPSCYDENNFANRAELEHRADEEDLQRRAIQNGLTTIKMPANDESVYVVRIAEDGDVNVEAIAETGKVDGWNELRLTEAVHRAMPKRGNGHGQDKSLENSEIWGRLHDAECGLEAMQRRVLRLETKLNRMAGVRHGHQRRRLHTVLNEKGRALNRARPVAGVLPSLIDNVPIISKSECACKDSDYTVTVSQHVVMTLGPE